MKTNILFFILFFSVSLGLIAQNSEGVSISENAKTPDASAILDISSEDKGVLFPRINLIDLNDISTITNPSDGLLIFNTNESLENGTGYYYWNADSSLWIKLGSTSYMPIVMFNDMRQMKNSLTELDAGLFVYVTDYTAVTSPDSGTSLYIELLNTFGVWYFTYEDCVDPIKYWTHAGTGVTTRNLLVISPDCE